MNQKRTFRPKLSREYLFEFISIFIAVIAAFALNNWNDHRKDREAEEKILIEIQNGLGKDLADVNLNTFSHKEGIKAVNFWRKVVQGEEVNTDSIRIYHFNLTRDLVSILNVSGYETLKSRGLELVQNDSLRNDIISLYEFDYQVLRKLEEEYQELQFQDNYFNIFNGYLSPFMIFKTDGRMAGLKKVTLSEARKNELLTILWKIEMNRNFILNYYDQVKIHIEDLKGQIKNELEQ